MASNYTNIVSTCTLHADNVFGPVVAPPCRNGFDFTLLFEQSLLSIAPSSIFLLLVPLRLLWLYRSSITTLPHIVYTGKALAISLLAGLQLALLILWTTNPTISTATSVPSAILSFIGALAIYPLSYLEHTRSIRPSTLLEVYLMASLLLNIPQARTLFLRHNNLSIAAIFTASIGAMLLLWILEARNKTKHLKPPYREYPPEATRGIWNRTFFWWLNSLFVRGFKRILSMDDLYQIPPSLSSERLRDEMQTVWDRRSKPESRPSLIWTCVKCLRWPLLSVVPPRLCLIGFNYAQPFLISRMISFVGQPRASQNYNQSLGLIAAAALIYTGVAVSTVCYMHRLFRSITMLRGGLVGLIFNKTLVLGDGVYDESAAITHMSTDIDRIAASMQSMHETWARLIEVSIGVWLLSIQLGAVSVVPIIVVIICAAINTRATKYSSNQQKIWTASVQTRIALTASLLSSMKSVKMMGLASLMSNNIHDQRVKEMKSANGYRWLVILTNTVGSTPAIFSPVLTFVAFEIKARAQGSSSLSTNQALTSLATITLLTSPASTLLTAIPDTGAAIGCFERIQKFLVAPSWEDKRGRTAQRRSTSNDSSSFQPDAGIELQEFWTDKQGLSSRVAFPNPSERNAILMTGITVKPSPTSEPAISDVNLQLKAFTTTILTGPVGSGKSTLMKSILGELSLDKGDISIASKNIGYCSQTPWILNTTIQRNICGSERTSSIDEEWYQSVLTACCLNQDLLQLEDGDQSTPGTRGLTLSGGQKQRVALARVLYAKPDIVLLDDVLSALDSKTERLITNNLLGPQGLFRKFGSTVVLITHSTRHFHLADHIAVLSKEGKISQKGSFEELKVRDGYVKSLLLDTSHSIEQAAPAEKPTSKKKRPAIKGVTSNDVTDLTRKTGDIAVYKYYFKTISKFGVVCFFSCMVLFVFTQFFPQIWLVWWTKANGHETGKFISVYVILAVASWFFRAGLLVWILLWISPRSSIKLHQILLQTATRAPQSFFAKTDTGVTLNRFSQDLGLIDRILPASCARVFLAAFTIIGQAALIAQGSSYMAIAIPFLCVAFYLLQKVYLLTSRQLRFLDLEARSPVYTHFLECLEGLSTIRAFGWTRTAQEMQIKHLDVSQRPYYLMFCLQRWLALVLDLMIAAVGIVVVALAVRVPGTSSGAAIGIALNNILGFNQSLRTLVESWTQFETSLGAIARLKNFEATVVPEDKPEESGVVPESWPDQGAIEFQDVTASYGPSAPALHNISMAIKPGQKIGICGRTGSGKSSLLLALFCLLELDSGTIFIDGIDLRTIPREVIRTRMIAIPQDPFVLSSSVRTNADPAGAATDAAIISALDKVQLWDSIQARGGLDAQMKAQPLSQGQQQLFCLARAMLRESRILVLDEATSNVDQETDALMQRVIRKEFARHTIVTVAHRLDTIADADVVAVLSEGRLVEFGKPEELLAKQSRFRELHHG
ncbi:putative multidrug resistance protein [Lepidopterella palustris CBS 459.81]|uniref:Putative multidrug resistance protein n=1 Tax=Lepidopterella palustris CBS 459.81 TaxID=1314670 RepID=A0A8E2JKF2_9PEZI|nr:putative multidrug resistance protein [Lepidopterella palustris CBS 459.81]